VTILAITLCILAQVFLVIGQMLMKRAMDQKSTRSRTSRTQSLVLGIAAQTVWFFLWLGLLQHWDLSLIFPFEGLNPLLLVLAAWLLLKEKLSTATWVGVVLITGGLLLVAMN
jgi:undecaprenyl phosphate-alpha-L-ara4N flippase subunit ArnE